MNYKFILSTCLLVSTWFCTMAQSEEIVIKDTSYWKSSLQIGVNFNQASFSPNWKAGGQNNFAYTILANGSANYLKGKSSVNNVMELLYGKTHFSKDGIRKSADKIFLDSKYGYSISKNWSLFASLNFLSQFDLGKNYKSVNNNDLLISNFFAPAYFTQSLGLEYKPVSYWWVRFGIGTFRQTFVHDQNVYNAENTLDPTKAVLEKAYGVERGKRYRKELALQIVSQYQKDVAKNININARYFAFCNYYQAKGIDVDHRFDATITAKVTKYITTSLTGTVLYDTDQDLQIQYTQGLAIGLLVQLK